MLRRRRRGESDLAVLRFPFGISLAARPMWSDAAGLQALMSIGSRHGYEHAGLPHERRIESRADPASATWSRRVLATRWATASISRRGSKHR
jgi:hypothetical protein